MEKTISNNRIVIGIFGLVFTCITLMYSCSQQRGLAQVTTMDTILVPKEWRPSTMALKAQQQQPTKPLKLPTEDQKEFNKKLTYVLDNAGNSFNDISLIRSDINDLKEIILQRAIQLRQSNDSLSKVIGQLNINQLKASDFAHNAELARIKDAQSTAKDREQNQAYRDAFTVYSTIGITVFVLLLIGVIVLTVMVYRQKNYLRTHFSHV